MLRLEHEVSLVPDCPEPKDTITSYLQFQQYDMEFKTKFRLYTDLDRAIDGSSKLFGDLWAQCQQATDASQRRSLKRLIATLSKERQGALSRFVRKFKVLHVELEAMRAAVQSYADQVNANAGAAASQ